MVTAPIVEEDEEPSPSHRQDELELDLAWALRPPSRAAILHRERDDDFTMEETRREIANLQLDMLRMGRNLKVRLVLWADDADTCVPSQNEIRRAVTPLLIDLKEGREVIERRRREIERLRRGY